MDSALYNLQRFIRYKTQTINQPSRVDIIVATNPSQNGPESDENEKVTLQALSAVTVEYADCIFAKGSWV